jgi:C1A family cysteine protease
MMKARLAVVAALALFATTQACAPQAEEEVEQKGTAVSKLGRPVTTPKAAGKRKTMAIPASHETPKRKFASGLVRSNAKKDGAHSIKLKANGALPESVDLSEFTPAIENQDQTSACVTYALGYGAMGWFAAKTGMSGAPYAPMYMYQQLVQGACDQGTMFEDAMAILTEKGIPSMSRYQPMQTNLDCATPPTGSATANAALHRAKDWQDLDLSDPEGSIKQTLASGVPVIIGMEQFSAIYNANAQNFLIDQPAPGEKSEGGHAVTIYAYDDVGAWFANSWGTDWGTDGWGQLSWEFVNGSQDGVPNINGALAITAVE